MLRWTRTHPRSAIALYLLALVLSNIAQALAPREWYMLPADDRSSVSVPAMTDTGPTDRDITLSYIEFAPPHNAADPRPPVICLHGSPGQATDFTELGPELAALGRTAYALDMPGFGMSSGWVPSYSARAYARTVLAFMDERRIDRAHVVGWSNGGAVALNIADLVEADHPDRLASITLLAAIACQETEGTGSFAFEHAKYAVGYAAVVVLPEFVPHFGLLFPREYRHAFIRNFWDTDQRPLRAVMQSLDIPVLVLHGRNDPLVADWAAERHHELIPTSRLIMTPHSHFMPFLQPEETAAHLGPFLARHDTPGVPPEMGTLDLAPRPERTGFGGAFDAALAAVRATPWWVFIPVFALLARLRRETATALAGVFVGHAVLDFGVAFLGLLIGRALHPREPWLRKDARWLAGLPLWTALSLLIAQLASGHGAPVGAMGLPGFVAWIVLVALLLNTFKLAPTRTGRRRIAANVRRLTHHEWWPGWLLYALLIPHFARLAARHRSVMCWTCVNPGIRPGGGVVGESKQAILECFTDPRALTQHVIDDNEPDRVARALSLLDAEPGLNGFPVIVKPDAGQRGAGVTLVHNREELADAVAHTPGRTLIQRYHPGPVEVGVFWVRDPATIGRERPDAPQGRILAVTRKLFPVVEGDGRSTLRDLILAHPRYAVQARTYLAQLGARSRETPPAGERVQLTFTGNHARGCRFEDGADLITPELTEAIDTIARTWRGPAGEPFDYGRFDIRSSSERALRDASDLAVIELNGVTSEATNLYDPSWHAPRALALLARQWSIAFELGAARKAAGARPLSPIEIMRYVLKHK